MKFLKSFIDNYPLLHKIDRINVNIKTRKVSVEVQRKQLSILSRKESCENENYLMHPKIFNKVIQIVR